LLGLNKKGELGLNPDGLASHFPTHVAHTNETGVPLGEDVFLQDGRLLAGRKLGGFEKHTDKLRPQGIRIVEFLAGLKKAPRPSRTPTEIAEALSAKSGSISNELRRIVSACKKAGIPQVLHKHERGSWGIAPGL